jgi:preprotein translocase subunit YajC
MMQSVPVVLTLGLNQSVETPAPAAAPVASAGPAPAPAPAAPVTRTENIGAVGIPGATTATGTTASGATLTQPGSAQPLPAGGAGNSSAALVTMLPLLMIPVLLYLMWMGSRRDKKRRAELMASLSNGDKVQTSGGVIGTIAELRDDEVVLRVDESSNTRIRFARGAVIAILSKRGGASSQAEAKPNGAGAKAGV